MKFISSKNNVYNKRIYFLEVGNNLIRSQYFVTAIFSLILEYNT